MINYDSVLNQLRSYGLLVDFLEVNMTRPTRCGWGEKPKERRGWYYLNTFINAQGEEIIAGCYGHWKGNDNNKQKIVIEADFKVDGETKKLIAAKQREQAKRLEQLRQREIKQASDRATKAWAKYLPNGTSDYLNKKAVGAHGVRFSPQQNGTFAIPMQDNQGAIFGLQIIRTGGKKLPKMYWPKGLDKKGKYHLMGVPKDTLFVAEGYATAATIYESTGIAVAVAFDAGNLLPVCQQLRAKFSKAQIVVCGDDDYLTEGNPGKTTAHNAAHMINSHYVLPDFKVAGKDIREGKKLTDFNDLANHPLGGVHLVREQLTYLVETRSSRLTSTQKFGNDVELSAQSVMSVADIAERFIYIDDHLGQSAFDTWTREVVSIKKIISLLPKGCSLNDLKDHYRWQERAVYDHQVGFDPTEKNNQIICNRYAGWPTKPNEKSTAADCRNLIKLLEGLCSYNKNEQRMVFHWVLKWLAYPIQNPGAKMASALIFHGNQGTGKSLFFETIKQIYGVYGGVINQGAMEDSFNSDWLDKKLFILADEVVANTERHHLKNDIKTKITGEQVRINRKMVEARSERNYMNLVFLSNEINPVVLENGDRRFFVVWSSEVFEDRFYKAVKDEIDHGGAAALHQYLLKVNLDGFNEHTKPPQTKAKQNLIELNYSPQFSFLTAWMRGELSIPFCPAPCQDLYKFYCRWCASVGERFPASIKVFSARIHAFGMHRTELKRCYANWLPIQNPNQRTSANVVRVRFYAPSAEQLALAQQHEATLVTENSEETEAVNWGRYRLSFINSSENDDDQG